MVSNNYSNAQLEAIEHKTGPLMVLAGPGSGKTFVITHRIRYLIEELKINPNNILVVTFSRAAAMEMKTRFENLSSDIKDKGVIFGTFHSVFFGLLKLAYGYRGDQIATEREKYAILQKILEKYPEFSIDLQGMVENILSEISKIKQENIDIKFFYSKLCSAQTFREIYKSYEIALQNIRKIDFDDMLLMTYELLSQREDIRQACINKYKYILVDEFQDINSIQYKIVRLLLGKEENITIVGDDDQSIYSFRGARPDIMLGFDKDYPKCKKVVLDINFRSTKDIVERATKLIRHNKNRFDKKISSFRGEGKKVEILKFVNANKQVSAIVSDIREYIKLGYKYSDIAVLYRTNIQPRLIIQRFLKLAIPFSLKDNIPNIYEHWIARDIIAYLRLATGIGNRGDLLRICNKPNRYIKREALEDKNADLSSLYEYYKDSGYMLERINELKHSLKIISTMSLPRAIAFIRSGIAYEDYLDDYCDYHGIEGEEFFDILDEIHESSREFRNLNEWLNQIEEYKRGLEDVKLNRDEEDEDSIKLMTFHASKGLEFKIVYIIDVNKGVCPYKKAKSKEEYEEERRMFYVAMTRARDRLNICTSTEEKNSRGEASEFIKELE